MKTFLQYMDEATLAQAKASAGPNTSPELVRRAAERSQRSAAQRNAPKPTGPQKGQKALPAGGVLAKRKPNTLGKASYKKDVQRSQSGSAGNPKTNKRYQKSSLKQKQDRNSRLKKYGGMAARAAGRVAKSALSSRGSNDNIAGGGNFEGLKQAEDS